MKLSLSTRLVLSYLVVILAGMAVITPLAWVSIGDLYLASQRDNLIAQARLIALALQGSALPSSQQAYSQTANASPGIHTRVLDARGAVVIELAAPGGSLDSTPAALPSLVQDATGGVTPAEVLARPEVSQALQGKTASATRRVSQAGGKPVLYVAAPVLAADDSVSQIVYLASPLADTRWSALPAPLQAGFIGVLALALLLASGMGFLLANRLTRPLRELRQAAEEVSHGNLGRSVPVDPSIPDLASLGSAFNRMTLSLRQADQAKTAFIADVSHELRTPLTVLKGSIETLQDGAADDLAAREQFLTSMGQETERLIRMVGDLLILTRADAGMLNLIREPIGLFHLAQVRCEAFTLPARKRQVRLLADLAPGLIPQENDLVLADADRLTRALDNLLDNALRYSPPGGTITVTLEREAQRVVCQVKDTGPGIPAANLPFIFDRFYRVDPSRDRREGGCGLGLAITRGLIQAHGGEIFATSQVGQVEGQGATFTFWLPPSTL